MTLTIYSIISKTLLTLVSVMQIEVTPCQKQKLCIKVKNTLSKDEINQMRKGKVTADAFDERIAKGWNIKDAVYLNHNFVPFKNGVYLAVPVFNDTYTLKGQILKICDKT